MRERPHSLANHRHAAAMAVLPFHQRDPFGRLLVAQTIVERVPILSTDALVNAPLASRAGQERHSGP